MRSKPTKTPIPAHLSARMRAWIGSVMGDYRLERHHELLLVNAAECWDRAESARKVLAKEGVTYRTGDGPPKRHPAAAVETANRLAFTRILRELGLDIETPEELRPPITKGRRYASGI